MEADISNLYDLDEIEAVDELDKVRLEKCSMNLQLTSSVTGTLGSLYPVLPID